MEKKKTCMSKIILILFIVIFIFIISGIAIFLLQKNTKEGIKFETIEFSLILPKSWKDRYVIGFDILDDGGKSYVFYNKLNLETFNDGEIFRVSIVESQECIPYDFINIVKPLGDKYVYTQTPTDVRHDTDDETLRQDYLSMSSDMEDIINSFETKY